MECDLAVLSSVDKALDILELLAHSEESVSLNALSAELGVPKSSAHRLLRILRRRGYVSQEEATRDYVLGFRIFELHNLPAQDKRLVSLARSHLRRLAQKLGQTINLAVLEVGDLDYWCHNETPTSSGTKVMSGQRAPLHCSGLGKMLLASLDPDRRSKVLQRLTLEPRTPRTITDLAILEHELREIAVRGYATDDEENTLGVRCIAAPIRGPEGIVIAAISITALTSVIDTQTIDAYVTEILNAAAELSAILGYASPDVSAIGVSAVPA